MSAAGQAVFLSYASQDAAAVARIADALRAVGVEVWFDQNELVGGDAWDAKIRKQIAECALFIPIISANTQARGEGYFRIEWRLAAQRTHAMADDTTFLLPVVIDETRDAEARVPAEFKAVQWTRLHPIGKGRQARGEDNDPAVAKFCARVKKLLGGEPADVGPVGDRAPIQRPSLPPKSVSRSWLVPTVLAGAVIAALAIWQPWKKPEAIRVVSGPETKSAPVPATPPQSEAQTLIARLWEIHELEQDATQEQWTLAEDLGAQAVRLEPNNADAWAAYSVATWGNSVFNHLPSKIDEATRHATRAVSLDPNSFEARLAVANLERRLANTAEHAEILLRQLVAERPNDKRALRKLSYTLRDRAFRDGAESAPQECDTLLDRAAALPGGDASALVAKSGVVVRYGYTTGYAEAEANLDAALKLRNGPNTLAFKMLLLFQLHGKLDEALALLKQAPSSFWVKPGKTATVAWFWLCKRDPQQALTALSAVQSDFLNGDSFGAREFVGPRSVLIGQAHQMAGKLEAAQLDWQAALRIVDQRLTETANDANLHFWKAWLLASLGRDAEARAALKIYEQISGRSGPQIDRGSSWRPNPAEIWLKLGELSAVLDELERREQLLRQQSAMEEAAILRNRLTYDPAWDLLRGEARFESLLRRLADFAAGPPAAAPVAKSSVVDDKSIAVLAFTNLSDDKANEYFSDGISEELLDVLTKVPGLKVTARTSSFHFKGKDTPIPDIARQLGVAFVLEGSVRKAGNKVRITAQLIKAADGFHVWSEKYDRELKDIFAVQDEIAESIVRQLRGRILAAADPAANSAIQAEVQAARRGGTKNPAALEQYLQGQYFAKLEWNGSERPLPFFQRAVELDPKFALGWSALAGEYAKQASTDRTLATQAANFNRSREAVERALALEPGLGEAWGIRCYVQLHYDFDWKGARESMRKALADEPLSGMVRFQQGVIDAVFDCYNPDAYLEAHRREVARDPVNPGPRLQLAIAYSIAKRYRESNAELERLFALFPGFGGRGVSSLNYLEEGRLPEALAEAEKIPIPWVRLWRLGVIQAALKNRAASDAALQELIKSYPEQCAWQIAEIHAYRGEADQAFTWLNRAVAQRDSELPLLKVSNMFRSLHGDPRWDALLRKLGMADGQLK